MMFTSASIIAVLIGIDNLVKGQPTLDIPGFNYCENDLKLTCNQAGFDAALASWTKDASPVHDNAGDATRTGRYSQTSTANSFTLAISGAISDDGGAFVCNYAFQDSNSVTLQLYCAPTNSGVRVTRNDQTKLVIDISHIYPSTATVTVTKDTTSLLGTTGTATANGDYFDIQWISNESIDDELHAYRITVVTRTTSTVIDKEVTFEPSTTSTTTTTTSPPPTTTPRFVDGPVFLTIIIIVSTGGGGGLVIVITVVIIKRKKI